MAGNGAQLRADAQRGRRAPLWTTRFAGCCSCRAKHLRKHFAERPKESTLLTVYMFQLLLAFKLTCKWQYPTSFRYAAAAAFAATCKGDDGEEEEEALVSSLGRALAFWLSFASKTNRRNWSAAAAQFICRRQINRRKIKWLGRIVN